MANALMMSCFFCAEPMLPYGDLSRNNQRMLDWIWICCEFFAVALGRYISDLYTQAKHGIRPTQLFILTPHSTPSIKE